MQPCLDYQLFGQTPQTIEFGTMPCESCENGTCPFAQITGTQRDAREFFSEPSELGSNVNSEPFIFKGSGCPTQKMNEREQNATGDAVDMKRGFNFCEFKKSYKVYRFECKDSENPIEIRRFSLPINATFVEFKSQVLKLVQANGQTNKCEEYVFEYLDTEGDLIGITQEVEFNEAVSQTFTLLKVRIYPKHANLFAKIERDYSNIF